MTSWLRSVIVFLFLIPYSLPLFSQTRDFKTDSLYTVVKSSAADSEKVKALNRLSRAYYLQGEYNKADSLAQVSAVLATNAHYGRGAAEANISIGSIYYRQGYYAEALKYELKGLAIADSIKYESGMGRAYTSIGNIYDDQENHEEALKYYQLSLQIFTKLNVKRSMGVAYGNIGIVYMAQKKFADALEYQLKALKIDEEIGDKRDLAYDYGNMGVAYQFLGSYKEALLNFYQNLQMARDAEDKQSVGFAYNKIAEILIIQHDYVAGRKYMDSAMVIGRIINGKDIIRNTYELLARYDTLMGNYQKSYSDYKLMIAYGDSMNNDDNTRKMVTEQMKYEFEKKQVEQKAEQDKKDALDNVNKKRQQMITYAVSGGLVLVILFSGLLFGRFKVTQKQKKIIEEQKSLVEERNKEVLDSITYAKRLQDAILPPMSIIKKHLPESFVLYKPKDIVAGDFYWMDKVDDRLFIAACDCTGHGVPGAMVSVVCSNALNRSVKEFKLNETGKILDKVRELVLETFEKSEGDVKDGMDSSFCSINTNTGKIEWSGAYNPLWYIEGDDIKEINGDKQPIGKSDNPKPFTTHTIEIPPSGGGGALYLFTDGYADQFGGDKGKKLKYKQFQQLIVDNAHLPMEEQKNVLNAKFEEWKGDLEQVDDVLVIGIRL